MSTHPVMYIHKAPWCGACKQMLSPTNFSKITSAIKKANPKTEVRIITHNNYGDTNKVDDYPRINYIQGFPNIMITDSSNANKGGDMKKVYIYNGVYDKGKVLVKESKVDIYSWITDHIKLVSVASANSMFNASSNTSASSMFNASANASDRKFDIPVLKGKGQDRVVDLITNTMEGKIDRKERSFRLVGINDQS